MSEKAIAAAAPFLTTMLTVPSLTTLGLTTEDNIQIAAMFAGYQKWPQSISFYEEALAAKPGDADLLTALALAQLNGKEVNRALDTILIALVANGLNPFAQNVLGKILEALARFEESEQAFRRAIAINPNIPAFHMNLAHLLQVLGKFKEAEASYAEAVKIEPTNLEARFYRSLALLTLGRFREGFREYELRYGLYNSPVPKNGHVIWRGQEPLKGKTILLCGEQGLGDCIQFARYAEWLKLTQHAKKVIVIAKPEVLGILKHVRGVDEVVSSVEAAEPYDFQVAMMSMPGLSALQDPTDQPWYGACPYLSLEPYGNYRPKMPRVGFCWRGNAQHGNDRYRSIHDKSLLNTLIAKSAKTVIPISLQYGDTHDEMQDFNTESFYQMARLIQGLDLVITVDTSIAHLAGAMGIPVWMMIPPAVDWRWGLESENTPWYPSMRIFRAEKPLEWQPVIERVREELVKFAGICKGSW